MNVLFKLPREAVPPEEQCLKFIVQAPDKIRGRLLKAKRPDRAFIERISPPTTAMK